MNEKEMLDCIRLGVDCVTPDVYERVAHTPVMRESAPFETAERRPAFFPVFARFAAVALSLVFVVFLGWNQFFQVDSVVGVDVNPSIEIKVNRQDRVVAIDPLNREARSIIAGIGYKNIPVEYVVNSLLGSLYQHGYLKDAESAILVSVENKNEASAERLRTRLEEDMSELIMLKERTVFTQVIADEHLSEEAHEQGLSMGMMSLIQSILDVRPELSFNELKEMDLTQLLQILSEATGSATKFKPIK